MRTIAKTTLDWFTFKRDHGSKKITCDCALTLLDEKGEKITTLLLSDVAIPEDALKKACEIGMMLHNGVRHQIREQIRDTIDFTGGWTM